MSTHNSKRTATLPRDLEVALCGAGAPARVLVADDDPTTGQLLATIGRGEGYQVVSVDDGRQAYRILKSDADFAAVVFNMTMPNLKGVDIVRYMKTEKRLMRIPVILVAGEHGLKLIRDGFAAGALAFLAKPFTTEKLARTLRLAIGCPRGRRDPHERPEKVAA